MFELHITNHLSILKGKMSKFKTPKNEKKKHSGNVHRIGAHL